MPIDPNGPWFEGRFSDGRTAAARDVRAAFHERGLVLRRAGTDDDDEPLIWPYGALTTAEPISSHAIDALVSYKHMPGASLFVPNGMFARRLAEAAPHLTTRAARRRAATPWLVAAVAAVLVAAAISALHLSPARTVAGLLPDGVRNALGNRTITAMTDGKKVCATPAGSAAVAEMSRRLAPASLGSPRFEITVVDWELVNAFAAPGNRIVLTRGLIEKAGGPDEVAGVLAHEMGHGIELHPEAGIVRAIGLTAAVELMLGGGGGTISNVGVMLAQLSYTRQAEREADERGLQLLREARISPDGIAEFFRRMDELPAGVERAAGGGGGFLDMLRTHPATAERLKRISSVTRYPATPSLSGEEWKAMQAMCGKKN